MTEQQEWLLSQLLDATGPKRAPARILSTISGAISRGHRRLSALTELLLILSICALALAFVALVGRWGAAFRTVGSDIAKLLAAVERAAESLFGRQVRMSFGTALVLFPLVVGIAALSPLAAGIGVPGAVLLGALSYLAGYIACCGSSYVAARFAARNVQSVHEALKRDLKGPSHLALRVGTASAVVAEVAALLLVCAVLGVMYALHGSELHGVQASVISTLEPRLLFVGLPSLALGTIVASMSLQLSASAYNAAANLGGQSVLARESIRPEDARNPALVSALAGRQLSRSIALCADAFSTSIVANSALLIAVALVLVASPTVFPAPLSVLALPLILRAVGLIAAAFGAVSGHTEDSEIPASAFWRMQGTAGLIAVAGTVGATIWCLGQELWFPFSECAALGIATALLVSRLLVARGSRGLGFGDSQRSTDADTGRDAAVFSGVRSGLTATLAPALVVAVALGATAYSGFAAPIAEAPLFSIAMFLSGYLTLGCSNLGISAFGGIADSARGLCEFGEASRTGSELARRSALMADSAVVSSGATTTYNAILDALVLMLACAGLTLGGDAGVSVHAQAMILLCSGLVGSGFVLAHAGKVLAHARNAAAALASNLETQLNSVGTRDTNGALPEQFTPSYQSCTETAEQSSVREGTRLVAIPVAIPVVGAVILKLLCGADAVCSAGVFAGFFLAVGVTGVVCCLGAEVTRNVLARQQLSGALPSPTSEFGTLQIGFFGLIAGPAVQSLVTATAAACLLVRPALH